MKKQVINYSFDASEKTITFTDYTTIRLDSILLITNVTDNIIVYNFAETGGSVADNILTLDYDTSTMDDTDKLMIYYDDGSSNTLATEAKQDDIIANVEPLGTPTTTNVTLTNADTDYKLPSSEKTGRRTIIVSNNSAYDVYLGQTGVIDCDAATPIGILLPAGGTITLDCSTGLYAQSDVAGVQITVNEF